MRIFGQRVPLLLLVAITVLVVVAFIAIVGNIFTPYTSTQQTLTARLKPPSFMAGGDPRFFLGTDNLGRDLVARLIAGARMSFSVSIAGTVLGALFGTTVGFLAARFRGLTEEVLMMVVDLQASLPFILIALTMLAFFGNNLVLFIILMGLFGWEYYARLSRGVVLSASNQPYAKAVRALGASNWRLYARHILPNVVSALIVQVTLTFPQIILLESSLSFLGLGIQPPLTSLGQVLGNGRDYLNTAWWISVWPGIIIFLVTLSMSITGDWLRDRLDPMLRERTA